LEYSIAYYANGVIDAIVSSHDYLVETCSKSSPPIPGTTLTHNHSLLQFIQAPILGVSRVTDAWLKYQLNFSYLAAEERRTVRVGMTKGQGANNVLKSRDMLKSGIIYVCSV
jgi:hypothetical protein